MSFSAALELDRARRRWSPAPGPTRSAPSGPCSTPARVVRVVGHAPVDIARRPRRTRSDRPRAPLAQPGRPGAPCTSSSSPTPRSTTSSAAGAPSVGVPVVGSRRPAPPPEPLRASGLRRARRRRSGRPGADHRRRARGRPRRRRRDHRPARPARRARRRPPRTPRSIDVAKIPRGAFTSQERINELLVEHARAGRRVVRLKGGDPFVFGRGGEEWQACAEAGLPVEVIPGRLLRARRAGAGRRPADPPHADPGLHRRVSGHLPPGDPGSTLDWGALARSGTTLVVLMGIATLPAITAELVAQGLPATTPALTVMDAGLPGQRSRRAGPSPTSPRVGEAAGRPGARGHRHRSGRGPVAAAPAAGREAGPGGSPASGCVIRRRLSVSPTTRDTNSAT